MLAPTLLVAGILLLTFSKGQEQNKKNCNIDSDVIFFDNEELEKLRNSFQFGGDCSPASWKGEFSNLIQDRLRESRDISDLSHRDRAILADLRNHKQNGLSPEKPEMQSPPEILFASDSQLKPQYLLLPPRDHPKLPYKRTLLDFLSEGQRTPQTQEDFFGPDGPRGERPPADFFELDGPQGEDDLFSFNSQRRPQMQGSQEDFFRPNSQRRPQDRRRPEDSFGDYSEEGSQNVNDVFLSDSQRKPQGQERPDFFGGSSGRRPQNQNNLFPSGNQRIPQGQERRNDFFGNNNVRRPQKQTDFFIPNIQRRRQRPGRPESFGDNSGRKPQNPSDFFRPDGLARPQFGGKQNDFFTPSSQTEQANSNFPVTQSPLTSTTLPGPPTWATPPSVCVQRCPNTPEYNPVCGSDRVSYRNPGRLRCEQRCGKAYIEINHYGNCITTTPQPPPTSSTASTSPGSTTSTTPPTFSRNM